MFVDGPSGAVLPLFAWAATLVCLYLIKHGLQSFELFYYHLSGPFRNPMLQICPEQLWMLKMWYASSEDVSTFCCVAWTWKIPSLRLDLICHWSFQGIRHLLLVLSVHPRFLARCPFSNLYISQVSAGHTTYHACIVRTSKISLTMSALKVHISQVSSGDMEPFCFEIFLLMP